jgi:mannosyltransferase
VTTIMAVSIAEVPASAIAEDSPPGRSLSRAFDPLAVAVTATVVSGVAAGRPSLWFDEGATISASASRSLPQLWRLLGHIDAVHGLYYLLMHGWFAMFPPTEFWSRVPSALAVGAAAAGVVVFARQFATRTTAVCAGIVFAILPRVTWAGIEARPYALEAAAAVWLTLLLVASVRHNRWWLWLLYALALMVSILLSINLSLLVPVYAATLAVLPHSKSVVRRWAVTSAAALAIMTPFIVFAHSQVWQVKWISTLKRSLFLDIVHRQYFDHSVPFAVLTGVVVVTAIVVRLTRRQVLPADTRRLLTICIAWIVIPTGVVVIYSAIGEPMYYPRYLILTAPAAAVVLAVCIVMIARRPWPVAAVVLVLAAAGFPNYLFTQRGPYAKEGWDYSQVADVISAHAKPGDCLLVDNTVGWLPGPIRALLATRPAAFAPLADIGRGDQGPEHGHLWDGHVAIWLVLPRLDKCTTVWAISSRDTTLPDHQSGRSLPPGPLLGHAPVYQFSGELGFRIVQRWQFHRAQVVEMTR